MFTIEKLSALEILDSRGRPTVKCTCRLASGVQASASVPSGRSTGSAEALELRDGDMTRYRGLGCRRAVEHVNRDLNEALRGREFESQASIDRAMIELDGTPNKSRLGANAILAVSVAFARAAALERGVPLYAWFAEVLGTPARRLPRLTVNLFSGGKHAGKQVAIQDTLVVPVAAKSVDESLGVIYEIYQTAADRALSRYGMRLLRADEGGMGPPFESADVMLDEAVASIEAAGFKPGSEVALAVDVASTHFYRNGAYVIDDRSLDSGEMIDRLRGWMESYPIISIEDGLAEEDWAHWPRMREAASRGTACRSTGGVLIMGDDFLCTNTARIRRAIDTGAADALLLKVNQIGTLTEAAEACRLARSAGWSVTVSARSGETEDDWLGDLAAGWSGDFIKIGSITQSERLAKYNRLLEIEGNARFPIARWPLRLEA